MQTSKIDILVAQARTYAALARSLQSIYYVRRARACLALAKEVKNDITLVNFPRPCGVRAIETEERTETMVNLLEAA